MQLSFQFTPDALWSDGTPLSVDDVACTVAALQSTPGSAEGELYRSVIEVRQGRIDGVVEVFFDRAESGYRMLFDRILQASVHEDLDRRSVYCSLTPMQEYPEKRDPRLYRYPDIIGEIKRNRKRYLECCLVLLRAYAAAGRPDVQGRPKGSFESWCKVVRDAIVWAGGADCELTANDPSRPSDERRDQNLKIVELLQRMYRTKTFTVKDVFIRCEQANGMSNADGELWSDLKVLSPKGMVSSNSIGQIFKKIHNRWLGDKRLTRSPEKQKGAYRWSVEQPESNDPYLKQVGNTSDLDDFLDDDGFDV